MAITVRSSSFLVFLGCTDFAPSRDALIALPFGSYASAESDLVNAESNGILRERTAERVLERVYRRAAAGEAEPNADVQKLREEKRHPTTTKNAPAKEAATKKKPEEPAASSTEQPAQKKETAKAGTETKPKETAGEEETPSKDEEGDVTMADMAKSMGLETQSSTAWSDHPVDGEEKEEAK